MTPRPSPARRPSFAGSILMDAQSRLIPYDIPLRYFLGAAAFHVFAWAGLAWGHADAPGYAGGTGPVLAALHALTLGVLAMTAMGASLQLLSVATGVATPSYAPGRIAWWLFLPGSAVLIGAMATHHPTGMAVGGAAAGTGLVIFAIVVADILRRAGGLRTTIRHIWAALACLVLLLTSGGGLIADFSHGVLTGLGGLAHGDLALTHGFVATFGFMGLMVFGFSYVLVPMFALAPSSPDRPATLSLALLCSGLAVAITGAIASRAPLIAFGILAAGSGVAVHLWLMTAALRDGMKKRLGLSFVLVRTAWVLLFVSLALGGTIAIGAAPARLAPVVGFLVVFGWLLSMLCGVLQRILPFLASMHAHSRRQRPPRMRDLGEGGMALKLHAVCHGLAVAIVPAGMAVDAPGLVLAGAAIGTVGAVAFFVFTLNIARTLIVGGADEPGPARAIDRRTFR